jgi:ACS family tartrate transporter-like MFS transporter
MSIRGRELAEAAAFGSEAVDTSSIDLDSIRRRFATRLLPLIGLGYFFMFLDRSNMPFVGLQMSSALSLTSTAFGLAVGMFSLGYCLFETPSTLALKRVGTRRWLFRIMLTWGILSAGTAFVTGTNSLLLLRFLLGAAEAGYFPGVIYYLSTWMPERERGRIIGMFLVAVPLSTVIGAPISGSVLSMNGMLGLAGWQWVFIAEGVPTVLLGLWMFFALPDRPDDVDWLSGEEKRWLAEQTVKENLDSARYGTTRTIDALVSGRVWLLGFIYLGNGLGLFGTGAFLPLLIGKLGAPGRMVGFWIAAIYLIMAIVMILWTRNSDRTGERIWHLIVPSVLGVIFLWVTALVPAGLPTVVAASAAMILMNPATPQFWNLPPRLLSGDASAAGIGLISSIGALGAFLGPAMLGIIKDHVGSFSAGFAWLSIGPAAAALIVYGLSFHPAFARGATSFPAAGRKI